MDPRRTALAFALALILPACDDGDGGGNDAQSTDGSTASDGPDDDGPGDDGPGDDTTDDDGPGDDTTDDDTMDDDTTDDDTTGDDTTAGNATTGDDTTGSDTTGSDTTGSDTTGDDGAPDPACAGGPLPAPIAGCAPPSPPLTDDPHQDCVDRINQLRWECQCLPPLMRWTDAETCTDDQSGADRSGGGAHANFGDCNEWGQNTCPNWGSEGQIIGGCLQSMWDEGPGEPFSAHGHYINMTNPAYTKVACGFSSSGGAVWSNQNFSN